MPVRTSIDEIESGDTFKIVRGSKAGRWGITGTMTVVELDDDSATVEMNAGKFGFNIDIRLTVTNDGNGNFDISATGSAFDDMHSSGSVVVDNPQLLHVRDAAGELADTVLSLDGTGDATLEAEVPGLGMVTLLIESD